MLLRRIGLGSGLSLRGDLEILPFPVNFSWFPLITFDIGDRDIVSRFGPHHETLKEEDFLREPGPCDYWAFRFECGLQIAITHYTGENRVKISADLPEIDHILRHLDLSARPSWRIDEASPDIISVYLEKELQQQWSFDLRFELWRQDDNGNKFKVGVFNSEREAACTRDSFEKRGHRQTYWIEQSIE